jgi:predicted amidophosphoribosyltransferase
MSENNPNLPWQHYAYGPYQGLLRQLLAQTKYHHRAPLARAMGFYLGQWLKPFSISLNGVVPIPLHPDRLRERGYNQAQELAKGVAEALNIPCFTYLHRIKPTQALHSLSPENRQKMLHGCFEWHEPRWIWQKPQKNLLLVDDIYTTGATIEEARRSIPPPYQVSSLTLALTRANRNESS